MKKLHNMKFISLLLALSLVVVMAVLTIGMAAQQPTVNLGTTADYAVLAGSTITNTGTTTISGSVGGNVGLFPGTDFSGRADVSVSGAVHVADDAANKAKNDLVVAFDDAAGRKPVTRISTELGGTTLTPGTYDSDDGTFQITGTLTLDAQGDPDGVFVFKMASTLITASSSNIKLINSARFCRTFWKVGSSATLGTNSHFVGHIFALTSIAAKTGATVQGQLLARNGAVTLDNNTITNGICAAAATTSSPSTTTSTTSTTSSTISSPSSTTTSATTSSSETTSTPGVTVTVTGGQLPDTATPWYDVLLVGAALVVLGAVGFGFRRRKHYQ